MALNYQYQIESLRNQLCTSGYCCFTDFLGFSLLDNLKRDFNHMLKIAANTSLSSQYNNTGIRLMQNPNSSQLIVDALATISKSNRNFGKFSCKLPASINGLIQNPLFSDLSALYLGPNSVYPSRLQFIQSSKTIVTNKIPFVPHFDRIRFLKFYFYLSDVGIEDGPFEIESSKNILLKNQSTRLQHKEKNKPWNEMPAESKILSPTKITANAGTLIIFDSNQTHLHGLNTSNKNRKVLIIESQSREEILYGYNSKLKEHVK